MQGQETRTRRRREDHGEKRTKKNKTQVGLAFLYQLLTNTGGGPAVFYVRRLVRLLLDLPSNDSRDIDDELGLKPRLEDYLHFVCYDGRECDRIPAVDRPFVLRRYFQYRNLKGLVCWYNYYNDYPDSWTNTHFWRWMTIFWMTIVQL